MKKVLSVILAVIMIITATPVSFAVEECEHVFNEETLVRPYFENNTLYLGSFTCGACNETVEVHFAKDKIGEYLEAYADVWYYEAIHYYTDEAELAAKEKYSNLMEGFYAKYEGINPYFLTEYEEDVLSEMIADLKVIAEELKAFEEEIIYDLKSAVLLQVIEDVLEENYGNYLPEGIAIREEVMNKFQEDQYVRDERISELYELQLEYAKEHPYSPYNPEYVAEIESLYDLEAKFTLKICDCIYNNIHLVERFVDMGDGTHKGSCIFCTAENITEDHTWGEYIENGDNTKTAKCNCCEATNTVNSDTVIDEPDDFESLNFAEKIMAWLKDLFDLLSGIIKSIFG